MMPVEAKFQSYVAFVARLRLQRPPDHATDMILRAIRACIKLENPFLWQFLTKNFHFGIAGKVKKCSFIKRFGSDAPYKEKLF